MLGMRGIPANYGGFETCVEEVAPRLADLGHHVTVYCRLPQIGYESDVYRGVRLVKLPTLRNKYLDTVAHSTLSVFHAAMRRYDVVIVFGVGNSPQALLTRLAGLPVLLNVDGLDWKRDKWPGPAKAMLRIAERLAGFAGTRTITDSHNVRAYYAERYGVDLDYIPYGASPGSPQLNGQLERLDLDPGGYFLYVGRLEPENRVLDLVEAARVADVQRPVVVVGDAPYSDDYITNLYERGGDHVIFTGAIYGDDYWELNHHAHAYVFPVASDGTHPALIEAMACGNPILARGIPDNRSVGGDAVRYYDSVEELIALMEWADRGDASLRQLGEAARERARAEFNWDRVTRDYLELGLQSVAKPNAEEDSPDLLPESLLIDRWITGLVFSDEARSGAVPTAYDAVVEQLAIHGVGPLLGERVLTGRLTISPDLDRFLIQQVERNHQRHRHLTTDLQRVLAAFQRDGIEIVPLKGSAMLLTRPDEVGWRPMADLDFLVRHPVQQEVNLAFAHAGYCLPINYSTGLSGLTWKHLHYQYCEYVWPEVTEVGEHPDHPRDVESHARVVEMMRGIRWDITGWIVNNLDESSGYPVPDDRAMALHLAVHLSLSALDSRLRMIQVVDLMRHIERHGVDAILSAVRKSGPLAHARFVYPALALVARYSSDQQIKDAVAWLRPYVSLELADWIDGARFYDLCWLTRKQHPVDEEPWRWAVTLRERARLAASAMLPLPRDLSGRYPGQGFRSIASWYPAYYRDRLHHHLASNRPG